MLFERKNIVQGQFTGPVFFGRKKYRVLLGLLIVGITILLWYSTEKVLLIQANNNDSPRLVVSIPDGKWHLSYTHSVQKTLVEEFFQVQEENGFLLYETRYSSYGVGLPFLATDGKLTILPDGRMQLTLQRAFPLVKVWTGQEAKVELKTNKETLALYKVYPPGSLLEISVLPRYKILTNGF